MGDIRYGRQTPTVSHVLPYSQTRGQEMIDSYNATGRSSMPWQELLALDMLATDERNQWVHPVFAYAVPRQNGKNEVISMRELFGLEIGEMILHTAHLGTTATMAFGRLEAMLKEKGIKEATVKSPSGYIATRAVGREAIALTKDFGGGKIEFRTRTSIGGLGESFDLLVVDEAQEYREEHQSAISYTIAASANPQTVMLGTPPTLHSSGTVFPKLRDRVLSGQTDDTGWEDWSVPEKTELSDVDAWYETNPALGYRIQERTIRSEAAQADEIDFNIQRLGLWLSYNQKSEIDPDEWGSLAVRELPRFKGRLSVGIKYGIDSQNVCLSVAANTEDGKIFVEVVDCRPQRDGNRWILDFLSILGPSAHKVVLDGKSGRATLEEDLKRARIKNVIAPTVDQVIASNAQFLHHVTAEELRHANQPALTRVITNCEKRPIGSQGGFGFRSTDPEYEIALMDSVVLAVWGRTEFEERARQKISY